MSIDAAVNILTDKITKEIRPEDALKYTQSVLNLAHALSVLEDTKQKQQRK